MDCDRYRRLTDADIHDETIHTTANHPWLTADHGWLVAGKLQVGEPVREADGSTAVVERLHVVPGAANMWDLTVSNIHTFAVGDGAFVVHNCGGETLNRFGRGLNTPDPRGPGVNPVRRGVDIDVDANDMVHAQSGQIGSQGASTFTDPSKVNLTGHYYTLPAGTDLPDGLGIVADGADVPGGTQLSGHRTIYPTRDMPFDEFDDLVQNLPWQYGGRIR